MNILISIIFLLIYICISTLFGWSEAMYWYYVYKGKAKRLKKYEHILWSWLRTFCFIPFVYIWFIFFSWNAILGIIAIPFLFPFFHDGMYYLMRNRFDGSYPKGWRDFSKTDTAKIKLNWNTRLIMFFIGIVSFTLMFII